MEERRHGAPLEAPLALVAGSLSGRHFAWDRARAMPVYPAHHSAVWVIDEGHVARSVALPDLGVRMAYLLSDKE
jgi:hypothetical protein